MNRRREFITIALALAGFGRRAWASRLGSRQAQLTPATTRYVPLTRPVGIPVDAVATPWHTVPFVAEGSARPPAGGAPRRVLINGVLFRNETGLSALCVTCPHEQCHVDLVTDQARLMRMTGGTPSPPLFECGCHFSVFDAAKDGARISGESPRGLYQFRIAGLNGGAVDITEIEEAALFEV